MNLWRHCDRRAICRYSDHPRKLVAKLTQINRLEHTSFFPVGGMPMKTLGLKDFSPKSQDAVALQQIKERGALLWLKSWWYPSGNRPLQQYLGFLAGRWLWSVRAASWQPDCKIQRSGRNGQRDWCMSRVLAGISALVICIIVCLSWAVNHYRDNAIAYKAQRDKNAEGWNGERGNYWHADASAWCCCARCKIHGS